jgi:ParB family chromosome partitioning protein
MSEKDVNPKKRGLGRGLNALFEDEEGVYPQVGPDGHTPGRKRDMLAIEFLEPGLSQPRRQFDDKSLDELAGSIKTHGLLQPILVRVDKGRAGMYEIIAGERRWRAAQRAQLHEVPVIILELSDIEALQIALIENLQREDLNPVDEARGYQRLLEDFGHTQEELSKALGKSRPHIANMVRLLTLPADVMELLEDGKISSGHARALVTADNPSVLAREVVRKGLNVRQTEAMATKVTGKKSSKTVQKTPMPKDTDTLALEKEVSETLGMRVTIDTKDGASGTFKVDFGSLDQLDDILARLSNLPSKRLMG